MQKWDELPGFRTYRDFFAEVSPAMRPIVADEAMKGRLIAAIPEIEFIGERTTGKPGIHGGRFTDILDDWRVSARVMEVRRGSEGGYYVRYEVASLYPDGEWATPIFLMAFLDGDLLPRRYTIIHGTGRLCRGDVVAVDPVRREKYDYDRVLDRFAELEWGEVLLLYNKNKFSENMVIWATEERTYRFGWSLHDYPWYFSSGKRVGRTMAALLVNDFLIGGILGIQDALPWLVEDKGRLLIYPGYYDEREDRAACAARAKRRAGQGAPEEKFT